MSIRRLTDSKDSVPLRPTVLSSALSPLAGVKADDNDDQWAERERQKKEGGKKGSLHI